MHIPIICSSDKITTFVFFLVVSWPFSLFLVTSFLFILFILRHHLSFPHCTRLHLVHEAKKKTRSSGELYLIRFWHGRMQCTFHPLCIIVSFFYLENYFLRGRQSITMIKKVFFIKIVCNGWNYHTIFCFLCAKTKGQKLWMHENRSQHNELTQNVTIVISMELFVEHATL